MTIAVGLCERIANNRRLAPERLSAGQPHCPLRRKSGPGQTISRRSLCAISGHDADVSPSQFLRDRKAGLASNSSPFSGDVVVHYLKSVRFQWRFLLLPSKESTKLRLASFRAHAALRLSSWHIPTILSRKSDKHFGGNVGRHEPHSGPRLASSVEGLPCLPGCCQPRCN